MKTFDCVEMKRRGAWRVQQEIAGLTPEEELHYWQQGTEELLRQQEQARQALTHPVLEARPLRPVPGSAPVGS